MDAFTDIRSDSEEQDDESFDLANLFPDDTGLPMVVWISDGTGVRNDLRVKVSQTHGARVRPDDFAVVSVRPEPKLMHGQLSRADLDAVTRWIILNERLILAYWQSEMSTRAMLEGVQSI